MEVEYSSSICKLEAYRIWFFERCRKKSNQWVAHISVPTKQNHS
jgi:hypothetical protein